MAKKMAGRLTVQERAQIAALYEVWNSVLAVQRWWRAVKGRNATVRQETIKNCHSKLLTTVSVTDARRSGRPSTSRSEENVALVRDMFTLSPRKSTRQATREIGLSRHTVRTMLKKDLNIRPRKPHYVQELARWLGRRGSHERPARSPDLTPCDFLVGLGEGGGVLGKTSHNGTIGGPDSERYHQRPTRLPAEDCGFHPRSFEEAGGCRRFLH